MDLQRNLCTITPDPARLLALDGVPEAVRQAGFRAGRMWIAANGDVAGADGAFVFRIDGEERERAIVGAAAGRAHVTARLDGVPPALIVAPPP